MLIFAVRCQVSNDHDVSPTRTVRPEGYRPRTPRHAAVVQETGPLEFISDLNRDGASLSGM